MLLAIKGTVLLVSWRRNIVRAREVWITAPLSPSLFQPPSRAHERGYCRKGKEVARGTIDKLTSRRKFLNVEQRAKRERERGAVPSYLRSINLRPRNRHSPTLKFTRGPRSKVGSKDLFANSIEEEGKNKRIRTNDLHEWTPFVRDLLHNWIPRVAVEDYGESWPSLSRDRKPNKLSFWT